MLKIKLPYPPSTNRYYRIFKGRMLISRDGRAYRKLVLLCVKMKMMCKNLKEPVKMYIEAFPPDNRKRDIDNIQKPLIDALEKAEVFINDSQIKLLISEKKESNKEDPHVNVYINTYGIKDQAIHPIELIK